MNIAIVAGVVVENDAISTAVAAQAAVLQEFAGVDSVAVYSAHVNRSLDCESHQVAGPWHLRRHPSFENADIAIFHWGIHYSEFDVLTLLAGGEHPRPIVHFHNVTPIELVPPSQQSTIHRSQIQFHHVLGLGVRVWAVTEYNRQTLLAWGARNADVTVVPFPIPLPTSEPRPRRSSERVEFISVGRFVPAKGQHVIVEAISRLPDRIRRRVRLRLVGSLTFSDADHLAATRALAESLGVDEQISFVDDADDERLWAMYRESDVVISASMHEGLCVPIIEGYAAGCRAIGTDAGNLPNLLVEDDELVPPCDADALAAAIARQVDTGKATDPSPARRAVADRYSARCVAEAMRIEIDSTCTPTPSRPSAVDGPVSLRTQS
jgi:glycosyltransferase involved in cell wall biosynthesis